MPSNLIQVQTNPDPGADPGADWSRPKSFRRDILRLLVWGGGGPRKRIICEVIADSYPAYSSRFLKTACVPGGSAAGSAAPRRRFAQRSEERRVGKKYTSLES